MYKVWYKVVIYHYGNYFGCYGEFNNLEDAIDKFYELSKTRSKNETYEIVLNWKVDDNV